MVFHGAACGGQVKLALWYNYSTNTSIARQKITSPPSDTESFPGQNHTTLQDMCVCASDDITCLLDVALYYQIFNQNNKKTSK